MWASMNSPCYFSLYCCHYTKRAMGYTGPVLQGFIIGTGIIVWLMIAPVPTTEAISGYIWEQLTITKTTKISIPVCKTSAISSHGPLSIKRYDVLSPKLMKPRSCEIECYNDCIALKFDRHLGNDAAEQLKAPKHEFGYFETVRDFAVRRPYA